ncbi:helix-turn-helix transcriptional regulator [Novosphingobium sp. ZN18A2]|uniref:helix-turn-helix domain-containing protein n=1 Tax=Novosphingobium sp. ZN18A2 TaxID=3079861 RepID=UPI0030CB360D
MLSPASCRAARDLLRLSRADLARLAEVSVSTLRRFETGNGTPSAYASRQILAALKNEGISFIGPSGQPELK